MPINIQHSGNVGQTIGLHYAGALGQFRQKERARQEQQALGYARMRANQQSQVFQADQQRQMAQFDAAQRWNMEEAKEFARQDREALGRQQGLEDIEAAAVAEEKIDQRELGQQQDAAGLLAAAKIAATKEATGVSQDVVGAANVVNFDKWAMEIQTDKQKQINLEQIKDKLHPTDLAAYEDAMQDIADARSDTEFRPADNYKIMQEAWQNILSIKDRVTSDMLPSPEDEVRSQFYKSEDGFEYKRNPDVPGDWERIEPEKPDPSIEANRKRVRSDHTYKEGDREIIPNAIMVDILEQADAGRESQLSPENQERLRVWREKRDAAYGAKKITTAAKDFREAWSGYLEDWKDLNPPPIGVDDPNDPEMAAWIQKRNNLGMGANKRFDYELAMRILSENSSSAPDITPAMMEVYLGQTDQGGGAAAGGAAVGGAAPGGQPTGAGGSIELYSGGGAGGQQPAPPATGGGDPGSQQPPPAGAQPTGDTPVRDFLFGSDEQWGRFSRTMKGQGGPQRTEAEEIAAQGVKDAEEKVERTVARVGGKPAPWYTSPEKVAIAEDRNRPKMEKYEAEIEEYEAEIAANEQFIEETMERIEATEGEYVQEGDVGEEDMVWKEGAQGEDVKQLEKFIKQAEEHNKGRQEQIKGKQGEIDKWDEELTRYKSNIESGNIYGAVSVNEFSTMDQIGQEAQSIEDEFGTIDLNELTKQSKAAATPAQRSAWESAIKRVQAARKYEKSLKDAGATTQTREERSDAVHKARYDKMMAPTREKRAAALKKKENKEFYRKRREAATPTTKEEKDTAAKSKAETTARHAKKSFRKSFNEWNQQRLKDLETLKKGQMTGWSDKQKKEYAARKDRTWGEATVKAANSVDKFVKDTFNKSLPPDVAHSLLYKFIDMSSREDKPTTVANEYQDWLRSQESAVDPARINMITDLAFKEAGLRPVPSRKVHAGKQDREKFERAFVKVAKREGIDLPLTPAEFREMMHELEAAKLDTADKGWRNEERADKWRTDF